MGNGSGRVSSKVSKISDDRLNNLLAECELQKPHEALTPSAINFEGLFYDRFPGLVEVSLAECMVSSDEAGDAVGSSRLKSSEYFGLILEALEILFPGMCIPKETMSKVKRFSNFISNKNQIY